MGGGKSVLLAQFLACCQPETGETIVVTTSSIKLVEQLAETIRQRIDPQPVALQEKVGCYYTWAKNTHSPVVVTCIPSTTEAAHLLQSQGRRCALWVADECHKTEARTVHEAHSALMPVLSLGLTATPYRADPDQSLSLFDVLLYDYPPKRALDEGVVVPWRLVNWQGGEADLDAACIEMTELARGPGMYNALSIADADVFVQKLNDQHIAAEAIHSKLSRGEINARLERLRAGQNRAIVHVSMLQEGVDLPWLRWLCMRRPVSSRVRFVQEIGRVLRSAPDKSEAVLYDPHDLFGQMSLTYEAVLGGEYLEPDDEEKERKELARVLEQSVFEMMRHLVEAKAGKLPLSMTPLAAYLRELIVAFDLCGLLERKIASRDWRTAISTERQLNAIRNLGWILRKRVVPPIHQKALAKVSELGVALNRGMASDLISIMISLGDKKKWPDFKPVDRAASESLEAEERKARGTNGDRELAGPPGVPGVPGATGATGSGVVETEL
jgi:superfamily II DNA or RNA helicase